MRLAGILKIAAEPTVAPPPEERPPTHPYVTGLKQIVPIGIGTGLGYLAGSALPYLYEKAVGPIPRSPGMYHALGGISAVAGGLGSAAASILSQAREAEAERANKEYQDYHIRRRARGGPNPQVQPPEVRA